MNKLEEIFDSYNRAVEKCHEDFFRTVDGKHYDENPEAYNNKLQSKTQECIKDWENTPLNKLEGLTPVGLLNRIDDFEQISGLFRYGAKVSDNGLPGIFIEKLESYGEAAADLLTSLAADRSLAASDEDMGIPLAAIKLLGKWKSEKTAVALLDILYGLDEDNELFMEAVRDTLTDIGDAAVELLVQRLENAQMIGGHEEYLLMALANIGESIKSDRIYRCLKSTFSRMNNKVIGIICLGNYGDGRAIPALRGYLQKNAGKVDSITFYELKSAVEKLGGSVDDIDIKPVRN